MYNENRLEEWVKKKHHQEFPRQGGLSSLLTPPQSEGSDPALSFVGDLNTLPALLPLKRP